MTDRSGRRFVYTGMHARSTAAGVCLFAVLVAAGSARAQSLRHRDPEVARPDLVSVTITTYEQAKKRSKRYAVKAREKRTYDPSGHIETLRHERPNGKLIAETKYTWNAKGHLTSRAYRDRRSRGRRTFSYKYDANGRIAERIMRDPKKPKGQYYRDVFTWNADGSHSIQTYRHYPKEGPYRDRYIKKDAADRTVTDCSGSGTCSMPEYDAHGNVSRIRQHFEGRHHYLVYENRYDGSGRLERRKLGGTVTTFEYNQRGDVVRETDVRSWSTNERVVYKYDYR